jgi:hypothetical protein
MIPSAIATVIASFTIATTPCPASMNLPGAVGCTDNDTSMIYVPSWAPARRSVVLHEKGHAFDYRGLDDVERGRISAYKHWPTWRAENFADEFAACWLSKRAHRKMNRDGVRPVGRADDRLCRMIEGAA